MPVAAAPPDYQLPVPFKKTTPGYKVSRFCRGTSPPEETVPSNIHQPSQDLRQVKTLDLNPWLKSARNRNFGTIANIASTIVLFFVAALTGCGGGKFNPTPSCTTTGFDNQTNGGATDSQLQALWQQAQRDLATQPITLNPVTVQMQGGTLETIAPDSRANGVQPQCVAVIAVADLTVAQLQAENPGVALQHNTDPTGVIHCPDGALAKYCHSFTASNNQAAYVAASQVLNFGTTGWEFENIILARLGYNTAGR